MAYTTIALVKTYAGISGTGDDTLLAMLIERAQGIIDRYTGRTFEASADSSRTFDSTRDVDGWVLHLDRDLCSITSVTNGDGTAITSGQYATEPRNDTPYHALRLLASASLSWEPQADGDTEDAITITGRWAYSTVAPDDIAHACIRLTAYLYRQKDNAADLDRPVIAGNATLLPGEMPQDIRMILEPYRRRF